MVQPKGARAGDGLLVLVFSSSIDESEEEVRCLVVPGALIRFGPMEPQVYLGKILVAAFSMPDASWV